MITLASAQEQLAAWTAASLALSEGQSFSMGGRSISMSDATEVREMLNYWSQIEARLLSGQSNGKTRRANFSLARF